MKLNERIVIPNPKTYYTFMSPRGRAAWKRRAVRNAVYELRNRILRETGEDIFQVFYMSDCIEVNVVCDIETLKKHEKTK